MVQYQRQSTIVHQRPVFYSLGAGFFYIGIFVCTFTITPEKTQVNIKKCPNNDKNVPMIYKYSIEGKEEGSGGYEKKECY